MTCLSSVPCGEEGFDHKEHQLCLSCKRRVPIPEPTWAFANSVSSCDKCNPTRTFLTQDYRSAPSGEGPHAHDWKDKPHRLVYDMAKEIELLKKLLWLRHDPSHFAGLYGDDGEMQCGACLIDFKRMSAEQIDTIWQKAAMLKLVEHHMTKLVCQDCGSTENVTRGPCPYASEINDDYTEIDLCPDCSHERAMDI